MVDLFMKSVRVVGVGVLACLALATPALADEDDLGAFIREGTCDNPGNVVEDIGDLDKLDTDDNEWNVVGNGEPQPDTVWGEDDDVDQTIDALTSGGYIVTIHERDDANAAVIACGELSGEIGDDGTLMIDLAEVDGSGFTGRVHFAPEQDDDDDETEVTTAVWQGASGTPVATPGA